MKYNVHVTAAFKVSHNINDVMPLLFDDQGKLRTFAEFKKAASKVFNDYNKNYLQAEWQTAFASAQAASKWTKFPEDAILQWRTQQDGRVRDGHKALHGTTYPKSHAFWQTHYTPFGWRCRCYIIKVASGTPSVDPKGIPDTPAMFRQNSGITGMVFDKQSPYFQTPPEMAQAAFHLFGLKSKMPITPEKLQFNLSLYQKLINDKHWELNFTDNESGGFMFLNKKRRFKEDRENIPNGKIMAQKGHGVQVKEWLNNGTKECDYLMDGLDAELKSIHGSTANNIDKAVRDAKNQADWIILELGNLNLFALRIIQSRVNRSKSIKKLTLIFKSKEYTFTREQILSGGWKGVIKK